MTDMEYTLDERVIRKPTHECPKSPTGLHDWYVLQATGSGAKDTCRWCEKVKHLTDPVLVAALRLTHDTPEAAPCEYCGGDLSDPEHFRTPLHRAATDPPVRSEQWGDGSRQSSMHLRPVTTHDTPEAVMGATLLYVCAKNRWTIVGEPGGPLRSYEEFAAALLAALPPGWCGHTAIMEGLEARYRAKEATNERLRQRIAELEARL